MKAFIVTDNFWMNSHVLVFCDTPKQAVRIAHKTEWLCEYDFEGLEVSREREADKYITNHDECSIADNRVVRKLGWCEEGCSNSCDECLLHQFPDVEESILKDDICLECREANK